MKIIGGREMGELLVEIQRSGKKPHVIGVERSLLLDNLPHLPPQVQRRASVTFYDDEDVNEAGDSAYCLGEIRNGQVKVTHKTYETLEMDQVKKDQLH